MLARVGARSRCLYARNPWRCPALRVGCMQAGEQSYRLYSCGRCAQQVRICRDCDRGNRYCAGECARMRRRESLHRAAQRYQQGHRGACRHAARQRVWRERRAQKVTHHGSLGDAGACIVTPTFITGLGSHVNSAFVAAQPHATALAFADRHFQLRRRVDGRVASTPRCGFCGRRLPRFARLGPLCGGP